MEKLVFDPRQAQALKTRQAEQLDASGMLDTVRGMAICGSLADAKEERILRPLRVCMCCLSKLFTKACSVLAGATFVATVCFDVDCWGKS